MKQMMKILIKQKLNFRGQVNYTGMIKKICEFNRRSEFILKVLTKQLKENKEQQIMILGHQKKLLQYLHDAIRHRTIATSRILCWGNEGKRFENQ